MGGYSIMTILNPIMYTRKSKRMSTPPPSPAHIYTHRCASYPGRDLTLTLPHTQAGMVLIWSSVNINYMYILELDPLEHISYMKILKISGHTASHRIFARFQDTLPTIACLHLTLKAPPLRNKRLPYLF